MAGDKTFFVVQAEDVREKDGVVWKFVQILEGSGYPVQVLAAGEQASAGKIAIVRWDPKKRNGLRGGFSSVHARIAPEKRIMRDKLPLGVSACERIVYVRDVSAKDPNALAFAVLTMLAHFGFRISPVPATQEGVAPREYALA